MIRPEMNIEAIAERFFSSEETQQLRALTGLEKRQGFFSCWTRKEAYLSQGRGASVKFDQRDPDAVARSIRELSAESGLSAALAVEAADFELKKLQWNAF
jgi:phosphopantetheinyl transferase